MLSISNSKISPLVSIILPTYNRFYCIEKAIRSVLNQTFSDFELIIIDNYSTDATIDLVNSINDTRIKFHQYKNNNIIAKSRNYGIHKSKGFYIAFLDSDDWWFPRKLEISVELLQKGFDFVYHSLYFSRNSKINFLRTSVPSRQLRKPIFIDLLYFSSPIPTSSVVLRKELMSKINGFSEDPKLVGSEDYDAWLRCSQYTDSFKHINKKFGCYTIGLDSMTNINRNIKSIYHLSSQYLYHLKLTQNQIPFWMKYALASAFFRKRLYKRSLLFSSQLISKPIRLEIYIKNIYIYIFSFIFLRTRQYE